MIRVRSLSFSYGRKRVLNGVDLELNRGEMTALLGANGAGKSTLIRCMLGRTGRYEGEITVGGKDIRRMTAVELSALVAYIPQVHYQAFGYSAGDMVLMGTTRQTALFASPGAKERAAADGAMERLGILPLAARDYRTLSGGEQQLVLIARAIAQRAEILLMDEPCASLDFGNQDLVMRTAASLAGDGYTVLISTHQPQHALRYADRAVLLKDGTVLSDGSPDGVICPESMRAVYGIGTAVVRTPYGSVVIPEENV